MKPLSGGLLCLPEHERASLERDPIVTGSLRFVVSNKNVTPGPYPACRGYTRWRRNVPIGNMPEMSKDEALELRKSIGMMRKEYRYGQICLRCGYCQPCPQGVVAPTIFRALDMYRNYPENLKHLGVELYRSLEIKADACEECKKCLRKMPAGLNIPEMLKEVVEIFASL